MPRTTFRPDVNGFAFSNFWEFDQEEVGQIRGLFQQANSFARTALNFIPANPLILPHLLRVRRELTTRVDTALVHPYGLCGGMAYASLDYYHKPEVHFPRGSTPQLQPTRGSSEGGRLRSYLWRRLINSLTFNVPTFLIWMAFLHTIPEESFLKGGPRWLARETIKQWNTLKRHIDAGRPWPLGLVGTTTDPTLNHQVVAIGYEDDHAGKGTIYLYDMNCPNTEQTIQITFNGVTLTMIESCKNDQRGPLQGFFCEQYLPNPIPPIITWP